MADYPRFPMFIDLSTRHVVVVGAGKIAARRAAALVQFTPHVTVIAPEVHPDLEALALAGRLRLVRKEYDMTDISGADMVLAATDDAELNATICDDCRLRGILANASSDRALCDFYFPGIVREGNIVVGVTASGEDHARARRVTEQIRGVLQGAEGNGSAPKTGK
ncbi:MAG: bifunctional precorrin-2 dehydrogenase/sirohydrochlorin ferrochelatase [Clostridia bacterium]|nr:bifunctional precorrin-2 dehydrogenase/sirohydrochlorin ferrochelatase [Clostridia bacterium]